MDSDLARQMSAAHNAGSNRTEENTTGDKLKQLKDVWQVQASDGNWNSSAYMCGMFNGLELAMAIMEGREPRYREKPKNGYLSETHLYPPVSAYEDVPQTIEQAPSVHKDRPTGHYYTTHKRRPVRDNPQA